MPTAVAYAAADPSHAAGQWARWLLGGLTQVVRGLGNRIASDDGIETATPFDTSHPDIMLIATSIHDDTPDPVFVKLLRTLVANNLPDADTGQPGLYGTVLALAAVVEPEHADRPRPDLVSPLTDLGVTVPPNGLVSIDTNASRATRDECERALSLAAHNAVWFSRLLRNHPIPTDLFALRAAPDGNLAPVPEAIRD